MLTEIYLDFQKFSFETNIRQKSGWSRATNELNLILP